MKSQLALVCLVLFCAPNAAGGWWLQGSATRDKPAAFSFDGVKYFHRFTGAEQHEYTPAGQADLTRWTDMMTINYYRQAKDSEALAATANAVLENYEAHAGRVLKTDSLPRRGTQPAEHLLVVLFARPNFIEVAFARFRMRDGVGVSLVYSHRMYGAKVGDAMSAWLETNGRATEQKLMQWETLPPLPPAAK